METLPCIIVASRFDSLNIVIGSSVSLQTSFRDCVVGETLARKMATAMVTKCSRRFSSAIIGVINQFISDIPAKFKILFSEFIL